MQEIERFFTNLFSGIFNRFKYDAIEVAERKAREAIDSKVNQQHQSKPEEQEEREKEQW